MFIPKSLSILIINNPITPCIYAVILPCETLNSEDKRLTINYKAM